ncbi:MAG: zinc carboxypeptidase, partial [Bacteroidota bacterium]
LAQVLNAGILVRTDSKDFQLDEINYPAGTLVITRADNRKNESFDRSMRQLIQKSQVRAKTINTGFTDNGPDLGSGSMTLLAAPKVAMIAGEGTFSNEAGQVWHYFEQRLDYPIHIYYPDDLDNWTGEDIDVLILPEGYYDLDDGAASNLSSWVRSGGKLIGIGAALANLQGQSGFGLSYKSPSEDNRPTPPHQDHNHSYAGAERRNIANSIPGAIFSVKIDNTHPLGFGLEDTYFTLKTGTSAFAPLSSGWNIGLLKDDSIVSGFVGSNAKTRVANTLVFGVENSGQGSIIYLVDNPLYRGFWENGTFLFSNAVFMVGN